jgi:hypothetical protein
VSCIEAESSNMMMKLKLGVCAACAVTMLALSAISTPAFGADAEQCVSDNPAVTAMRASWDKPVEAATKTAPAFSGAFNTAHATLLPYDKAALRYGRLAIKSKKDIKYFDQFVWNIAREGDYWIAADSGVWIDVIDANGHPLETAAFNHGLRCAGIFKAVKFHIPAGTYHLVIASESADSVKFSAQPDGAR